MSTSTSFATKRRTWSGRSNVHTPTARAPGRPAHVKGFAELPQGLRTLIETSYALNDRIFQLDRAIAVVVGDALSPDNPVGAQMNRLEEAFAKAPRRAAARG